jgi:hypothetical protein
MQVFVQCVVLIARSFCNRMKARRGALTGERERVVGAKRRACGFVLGGLLEDEMQENCAWMKSSVCRWPRPLSLDFVTRNLQASLIECRTFH